LSQNSHTASTPGAQPGSRAGGCRRVIAEIGHK
jgi:hypothetical protein